MIKQHTKLVIALFDQPHVGWDYLLTNLLALKCGCDLILHVRAKDWLRIYLFHVIAHWSRHMLFTKHVVVRRWYDVGPMRLYKADVGTPWAFAGVARLIHEIDGLTC